MTAVALASVLALVATPEDPAWRAWLDHRWTKTVRRGTGPQIESALPFAAASVEVGGARALGFLPCTYGELAPPLVKMQVAFFERDREGDLEDPGCGPVVSINPGVEMSSGKTAAQAAHGIFRWWVARSEAQRSSWLAAGHPLWVRTELPPAGWADELARAEATVNDAGLTEIERGALTVAVRHRPA